MKCPCTQDCKERTAECHSTCSAYLEYESIHAAEVKERQKEKRTKHALIEMSNERKIRSVKRKNLER